MDTAESELRELFPGSDLSDEDGFSEIVNLDGTVDPKHFKPSWLYKYVRFADGRVLFCDACSFFLSHSDIVKAYSKAPPFSAGSIQVRRGRRMDKRWAIKDGGSTTTKLFRRESDEKYIAKELGPDFTYDIEASH
jgi:hypothetical protein